jgi:hypothetical protein
VKEGLAIGVVRATPRKDDPEVEAGPHPPVRAMIAVLATSHRLTYRIGQRR